MKAVVTSLAAFCVLPLLICGLVWIFVRSPLGILLEQNPGPFDRERFEAVVARVRSFSLPADREIQLRLDDLSEPSSLRVVEADDVFYRGQGAGNVWARVRLDGALDVVVATKDLGHAGQYGFAYSDVPQVPESSGGGGWSTLEVPGHICWVVPRMRIDAHWWAVLYNRD